MTQELIPPEHRLARYCPPSKSEGDVPEPTCFEPRFPEGVLEDCISANWLEAFSPAEIREALDMVRDTKSDMTLRRNGAFAILALEAMADHVERELGMKLDARWKPKLKDVSHAGLSGYGDITHSEAVTLGETIWEKLSPSDIHKVEE